MFFVCSDDGYNLFKPGADFNDLPDGFVVFICTFDPFDEELYRYTYEETCAKEGGSSSI